MKKLILFMMISFMLPTSVLAAAFGTPKLYCHLVDDIYFFDAEINYHLTDVALEALTNGVPLIMQLDIQLSRQDSWIWEPNLLEQHLRYQIKYQHLSSLFIVTDLNTQIREDFLTLEAAISFLGTLTDVSIIQRDKLIKNEQYTLELVTQLDVDVLPLPLRPFAYINPSWHLSSDTGSCVLSR